NIDLMSVSGHKIHSLKGVGFLYIRKGIRNKKIIFVASKQNNIRSGTINNEGIISLASASKLAYENINEKYEKVKAIRNEIIKLKDLLEGTRINGDEEKGLPYILSLSFENVKGEVLLHALEDKEIYVSTGSACSNKGKRELSTIDYVAKENIGSTIRVSFSSENTIEEAKKFNEAILQIVPMLRMYQKR
ncbi:MAG: aminotransferase class V-fold PLP-dependent enzyme, partial [Eubacteriales bacterium]|nr:aminotransferase class V-fold PLP-dependent enzyme [Eubacteriales bacterium]